MRSNPGTTASTFVAIALIAGAPALAQVSPTPGLGVGDIPAWLNEALARESGPFDARPFTLPERAFKAELRGASVSAAQETSRGWYVTVDIEAITPMECWVFTSPVDMAATLRNITEQNLAASARASGPITDRGIYFLDAGVIERSAYMSIETLYSMQAGDENRPGFAKVRIARADDLMFACSHNQLGFRETFADSFEHFVRSASFERQSVQPFYRQVYRQAMDGLGLGIIEQTMAIDGDGDLALTSIDSMLVPETNAAANASDTYDYGFLRPGFEIINFRSIRAANGEIFYNLNFQPAGENVYQVIGEAAGEEFNFPIEDQQGPASLAERMLALQELLADPERSAITFRSWQPDANLGTLTETTIDFGDDGKESLTATVSSGENSASVVMDQYGSYVGTRISVEQGEFSIERVLVEGQAERLARFE